MVDRMPHQALANIGAGAPDRDLAFDSSGDPEIQSQPAGAAVNNDLFTFHIDFPQQKLYVLVNYWDKAGSIINASAFSIGGNTVWTLKEIQAGTGLGTPLAITGLNGTATGASRNIANLKTAGTDGTEDFAVEEGLAVNLTSVGGLVTDFIITVSATRPG